MGRWHSMLSGTDLSVVVFTGTQAGTTEPQRETLREHLYGIYVTEACHGLAVGADYDFHQICRELSIPVRGYPANVPGKRADIPAAEFTVLLSAKNPLERNHDMIDYAWADASYSQLIVCPKGDYEELRSGTWAAVRYARSCGLNIAYIWPSDGALELREYGSPHYHSRIRHV